MDDIRLKNEMLTHVREQIFIWAPGEILDNLLYYALRKTLPPRKLESSGTHLAPEKRVLVLCQF